MPLAKDSGEMLGCALGLEAMVKFATAAPDADDDPRFGIAASPTGHISIRTQDT
ncbi:hypothetical protein [Arthrobacter sp. UYEF3]|uniref:hypothetical protein n=1 Tax=Arthrobacter sp. UYEF3 TaxID=1756365 RepID=UPI0033911119